MKGNFKEEKKQPELFQEERDFLKELLGEEIFDYYQIKGENSPGQCENCFLMDGKVLPFSEAIPGVTLPPFHPNCKCKIVPSVVMRKHLPNKTIRFFQHKSKMRPNLERILLRIKLLKICAGGGAFPKATRRREKECMMLQIKSGAARGPAFHMNSVR